MEFFELLGKTVLLRPYVFAFLAAYGFIAVTSFGWRRTAIFTVLGYTLAWGCELSSIHTGFPFGEYRYIEATRNEELWVAGVPFMDSLSFVFLIFTGYTVALFVRAPHLGHGLDLQVCDTSALRRSPWTALFGAFVTMLLDVVIDPWALRGDRSFLGKIYYYRSERGIDAEIYFGVPVENFLGWFFVAALVILAFQAVDRLLRDERRPRGVRHLPAKGLFGPLLYLGILVFNLAMTFAIGEPLLGIVGILIHLGIVVFLAILALAPWHRAGGAALAAHLADFPWSPLGERYGGGADCAPAREAA